MVRKFNSRCNRSPSNFIHMDREENDLFDGKLNQIIVSKGLELMRIDQFSIVSVRFLEVGIVENDTALCGFHSRE